MIIIDEYKYVFYFDFFYFVKGCDNEIIVIKELKFWMKIRNINICCV